MKNILYIILIPFFSLTIISCSSDDKEEFLTTTNTDDETAGFTVSSISGNTTEAGGTVTFTVKLSSHPTANVTIGVSSSNTTEGTVSPSLLTFTSSNWNANQTVTVTGVNDYLDDGNQSYTIVLASANSSDSGYSGLNPTDVSATNSELPEVISVSLSSETTTKILGTTTSTVGLVSVNGLETNATWQFSMNSGSTWTSNITGSLYVLDTGAYSAVMSGSGRAKQTDQAGNISGVSTVTSTLSAINCSGISVTLAKIDDDSEVYVNGTVRASKGFSGTSQETSITSHLVTGENKIVFKLTNGGAGWTYTYKIKKDSTYLFDETCGNWNIYGCNSNNSTGGLVVEIETTIKCE